MRGIPPRGAGYKPAKAKPGQIVAELSLRVAELETALDAVRALHPAYDESDSPGDFLAPGKWCPGCGDEKPCKTRRAIRATR